MIYILSSLAFVSLGLAFTLLVTFFYWNRLQVKHRLNLINETFSISVDEGYIDDRKKLTFRQRVIIPIREKMTEITKRITPKGTIEAIEKKLKAANNPFHLGVPGWLIIRIVVLFAFPVIYYFFLMKLVDDKILKILVFMIVILLGNMLPNMLLNNKIKQRKTKMTQQLPDILDLLTVSVEAGLSFDGAMAKVAEKGQSEMSKEFAKAVKEIEIGKTRRAALTDMSLRCDIPDLQVFISSIIQAEQMGVSIGKILRIQAVNIRIKRRQRAQETALKAPVKMLFPLVFFIFPSLFIVLLGPALIRFRDVF